MTDVINRYTYRITWSQDDREHVGLCLEFPGLSWLDVTPEAALRGIRELARTTVADMQETGEPIPEPLSSRHFSGRFLVRLPPETHRLLAMEAAESGVSLNRLVASRLQRPPR